MMGWGCELGGYTVIGRMIRGGQFDLMSFQLSLKSWLGRPSIGYID